MGEKMFIMQRIRQQEFAPNVNQDAVRAYNKMHARFKVQMEWGIGGVKKKWKHFMKRFPTKEAYGLHISNGWGPKP
jgi:hypothetical protein